MSDERTRGLERRFRETGGVDDEARWLAARVRAGEVSRGQVRLAVLCGHPAARRAQHELELPTSVEVMWSVTWERSLADEHPEALLRVVVALARAVLLGTRTVREASREALLAAEDAVDRLARGLGPAPNQLPLLERADAAVWRFDLETHRREHYVARAAAGALECALHLLGGHTEPGVVAASNAIGGALGAGVRADGTKLEGHEASLLAAIAKEVIPWVLGDEDPLTLGS